MPSWSAACLSGLLLREAIEDLEWTGGEVEFVMRRSPMRFALRSVKQQSLEVGVPWGGWGMGRRMHCGGEFEHSAGGG